MIDIIDNLLYATHSPSTELIYPLDNPKSNPKILYRTKFGKWFFHHLQTAKNEERIEPINENDAFGFLQSRCPNSHAIKMILFHFSDRITPA